MARTQGGRMWRCYLQEEHGFSRCCACMLAAVILALAMSQTGRVDRGGMGRAGAARFGSAADAFSPDPSKRELLRLAVCAPSRVLVGWALTV